MQSADLLARSKELDELSRQLCERSRALIEESQALCADAQRRCRNRNPWFDQSEPVTTLAEPQRADESVPNPHDQAMDALHLIRIIIDPFPLKWQVAIVKALTARTLVRAHERTRPAPAVLSA